MPTIVVKSIGTAGRNYSTVQAWDDACPVSLVAVDQVWKGECYNDTRLDGAVTLQGATTDVTRYMWLTTGPGQSFRDGASVRTSPLNYNEAAGATLYVNTAYTITLLVYNDFTVIEGLQIFGGLYNIVSAQSVSALTIKACIVKGRALALFGLWVNSLVLCTMESGNVFSPYTGTLEMRSCTMIALNANVGVGNVQYGVVTLQNSAVFGFVTGMTTGGPGVTQGDHNGTDLATAPGTNNQLSKTFANQFVNTVTDFRAKTGADLANTGTPSSYALVDITGLTRSLTTPTIGCWELAAAAPAAAPSAQTFIILPL